MNAFDSTLTLTPSPTLDNPEAASTARVVARAAELRMQRDELAAKLTAAMAAGDDCTPLNRAMSVVERDLRQAESRRRFALGLKQWTAPSVMSLSDWGPLTVDELRSMALGSEGAATAVMAAVELVRLGEVVCTSCDDNRWVLDNLSPGGEPWNEVEAPCVVCNESGEASEGEPMCDPALLPLAAPLLVTMPTKARPVVEVLA